MNPPLRYCPQKEDQQKTILEIQPGSACPTASLTKVSSVGQNTLNAWSCSL